MPMSATVPTDMTSKPTFHTQILCCPNLGHQIIIAGNLAPTWGAILYLFAKATQSGASYNIFMIRVRRVEGAIKQKILRYAVRRAQFYKYVGYLRCGNPIIFARQGPPLGIPLFWPYFGYFRSILYISRIFWASFAGILW